MTGVPVVKAAIVLAGLLVLAVLAPPAGATGGSTTFRILAMGGVPAFSPYKDCTDAPPEQEPTCNEALAAAAGGNCPVAPQPSNPVCFLAKTMLGYDGLGAVSIDTTHHVSHAFACMIAGSATGPVTNAIPAAGPRLFDRLVVGFDTDGDGLADVTYGEAVRRPAAWAVAWRVAEAAYEGDGDALVATPQWVLDNTQVDLTGAGPAGVVAGPRMFLWTESPSADLTVQCMF